MVWAITIIWMAAALTVLWINHRFHEYIRRDNDQIRRNNGDIGRH